MGDTCQFARHERSAHRLLAGLKYFVPRLKAIWADSAYRGKDLADWCKVAGDWDLDVLGRVPEVRGFTPRPKRWIVERSSARLGRPRRLSKDYERQPVTSEALVYLAGGEIATTCLDEQELATLCLHLLQISMVYIKTLMLQEVLTAPPGSSG